VVNLELSVLTPARALKNAASLPLTLQRLLGVSRRTVLRWRRWWTQDFTRTSLWRSLRSRLMQPIASVQLPQSLLDRFGSKEPTVRMAQALHLLSPLSVSRVIS
jgi:hypothetical protein